MLSKILMKKILLIFLFPLCIFAQDSPSPYGINAHLPNSAVLDKIKNASIKWVRLDFNWYEIEPYQGYFRWENFDRAVNQAFERGLSIFATLSYTPPWAGDGSKNSVPKDSNLWKNFVKKTVERYKGKILYWGMWNEPNLKEFWKGTVDEYISIILIPGYETVKKADPNSKVVAPELSHLFGVTESRWDIWLRRILSTSKEFIDVISHHIYDLPDNCFLKMESYDPKNPLAPSLLQVLREEGASNKPLWITETGWHTWEVSEETQADYYKRFLQLMKSKDYVNKVFFYEIIDDPRPEIPPYGILRSDLSEKRAYFAYKEFIEKEAEQKKPKEGERCPVEWIYRNEEKVQILNIIEEFKEHILSSSLEGMENVKLYYKFAPEITQILSKDRESEEIAKKWIERVEIAIINGENFVLEEKEVNEILKIIERFKKNSSPSLKKILEEVEKEFLSKDRLSFSDILNSFLSKDFSGNIERKKR